MVSLTNEEEDHIQALVECLAHAIHSYDEVTVAEFNKTLVQKFVYLGATEFDLSVTYSWYLAGSLVESDSASPNTLSTAMEGLPSPTEPSIEESDETDSDDPDQDATSSLEDVASRMAEEPADIRREFEIEREADPQIEPSEADRLETFDQGTFEVDDDISNADLPTHPELPVQDCIEYYHKEMDRYPLTPTDRFLQQFYKYHAPEPYTELYVNCLHVRSLLRSLEATVQSHVDGETPAVTIEEIQADLNRHISRVHLELANIDSLKDTVPTILEGTDIIEDTVMKLNTLSTDEYELEHVDAVATLQDFYFMWVWKYPALKISAETATGPSADRITRSRCRSFDSFEEDLTDRYEQMRRQLDDVGLIPEYEDYPDLERTPENEAIVEFTNAYFDE
jgi:hypothetical protein